MTSESAMFTSNISLVKASSIHTADNSKLNVSDIGDISNASLSLSHTFLVPKLTLNLIFVGQLCELRYKVCFSERGHIIGTGHRVGCLLELVSLAVPSTAVGHCGAVISPELWHSCLGHVSFSRVRPLISSGVLGHINVNKVDCQSCRLAKFHALPFINNISISQAPFDLVHYNIWGTFPYSY